jgi:hypothetical protein
MKSLAYFLFAAISFSFVINEEVIQREVLITTESFLYIKGTSNINTFTCVYDATTLSRKVPVRFTQNNNTMHFKNVQMQLKNTGFNCGNRGINNDFHDLLQTKKYPNIHFGLLSTTKNKGEIDAHVAIEIAGIKKQYKVPVKTNGELAPLEGVLCVNITDFGLTPPTKMMGMIVVREDIEIVFGFDLQVHD